MVKELSDVFDGFILPALASGVLAVTFVGGLYCSANAIGYVIKKIRGQCNENTIGKREDNYTQ